MLLYKKIVAHDFRYGPRVCVCVCVCVCVYIYIYIYADGRQGQFHTVALRSFYT